MRATDLNFGALSIVLPLAVLVAICFIKFAVVLAILRRAIGAGAIPPASVATTLALLLALLVTAPVADQAWSQAAPLLARGDAASLGSAAAKAAEPVRAFLEAHTPERERDSFRELALKLGRSKQVPPSDRAAPTTHLPPPDPHDLRVLAPAFATAQLKAAFEAGFLLYLPFLVIELVVASVLLSVGMTSLTPEAVSLPFKLLLFLLADGWHLLLRGLVLSST